MHTQIRRVGDEVVITLDGDADLAAAPRITQALQRAIAMATDSASALTVDLDGVLVLDDTALGLLVGGAAGARRAGLDTIVICSDERLRARLIETRLDRILTLRPPAG